MKKLKKVLSITLVFILLSGICGCAEKQTPSNMVKNYLEEVKKGENADFSKLLNENLEKEDGKAEEDKTKLDESEKKMINSMNKLTYKINSENIDGDSAVVNVTATAPDLAAVIGEFLPKAISVAFSSAFSENNASDEENKKVFDNILSECLDNVTLTERTQDIHLEKVDEEWKITDGNEMAKLLANIDPSMFNLQK
ncbi:DUF4878 domain-containing protein [Clostridium botulinum]|uniref:DUF4878 domain-containing protein n=1 Tax=Clostridium TaxID=1485 RepID=UPI000501D9A9|nr:MULTISPECIES: DUF4878 domain-containing protein [unclassified Clostridium]AIY78946.1 lumazine-binding domain protein [Clostridium botulinum 202F]KAI3347005.1 DUF4878 domain-containing protein [Clostridium botulinum]KFX55511.1 lipoprotein [Clostridium botulinum]KFX55848.1 lipoprotein [Clostridium botulinum]KON13657.1 lipoprotein [Clostridium botulinum]